MSWTGTTSANNRLIFNVPNPFWGFCIVDNFKLDVVEEINVWMTENFGPRGSMWDTKPMAFQAAAEHYKAVGLDRRMYMFDKKEDFVAFKLAWF